jgi:hypothetical protein
MPAVYSSDDPCGRHVGDFSIALVCPHAGFSKIGLTRVILLYPICNLTSKGGLKLIDALNTTRLQGTVA